MSQPHDDPIAQPETRFEFMIPEDRAHFAEVALFAKQVDAIEQLADAVGHLSALAENLKATCRLGPDFAPHSFTFALIRDGQCVLNGGVIYEGPGCPADGSFPSLTVSLTASKHKHDWRIHT